VLKVITKPYL